MPVTLSGEMAQEGEPHHHSAADLDEQLAAWRERPLAETPYLVLDARYEKVRQSGLVQDAAVLVAIGVGLDGKRDVLGVSVALSEHETH